MNFQEVIVYLIFGFALIFLGVRVYKSIFKKECNKGCAGCGSIDFSKIDIEKSFKKG